MKYIRMVLTYFAKHFLRVILPILPSALILGIFSYQVPVFSFIEKFTSSEINRFGDVFKLIFAEGGLYYFLIAPIAIIVMCFSCSYLMAMVYKHFRTGKLSVRMPLANINNGLQSVFWGIIISIVILFVYRILLASFVALAVTIFPPNGYPGVGLTAFVVILNLLTYPFIILFTMYFVLSASSMLVYGYSFPDALSESLQVSERGGFFSVICGYFFPFVVNALVAYLCILIPGPHIVGVIINVVSRLFLLVYLVLFSVMVVFDQQRMERLDLKKLY